MERGSSARVKTILDTIYIVVGNILDVQNICHEEMALNNF